MTDDDFETYLASLTDTPVMASVAEDAERRTRLEGREVPLPEGTRIITIANQKGGVGKTTTAVNLAAALAQSGHEVLVIDIDPQGNASTALSIPHGMEDTSIYDVLLDGMAIKDAVQSCPTVDNVQVVPATIELAGAEIELVNTVSRETKLREAIHVYIAERAAQGIPTHYVLIDCPPSLGLLTINALTAAREVLIPIQTEYYALEGLSMLVRNIDLIRESLNPELRVSMILLTMYDKRTKLSTEVADEVRSHFPNLVLESTIPRSVRIAEAPSHGETIITYDPSGTGALSYLEAAAEIADRGVVPLAAR